MRFQDIMRPLAGTLALIVLATSDLAKAFTWRSQPKVSPSSRDSIEARPNLGSSQLFHADHRALTSYEIAMKELQQLESEPVCHRTAARLLINNCQVLNNKDEATILTDSGRQIRDFVDAYAASLAICDLERGSFTIPRECDNFREPVLNQLSMSETPFLHVGSKEIDGCLSGLGASDSGWNTWISYRHKALRFCEAARSDNEKSEHIRLFQRLTKVMGRMTDDLEQRLDKRMADLDSRTQVASDRLDHLSPLFDHISTGLDGLEDLITGDLSLALQRSADTVNAGMDSAASLQRALDILVQNILDTSAETASAHIRSMEIISQKADSELATVMSAMTTAVASATSLQNQIELAHRQSAELEYRQSNLEEGMVHLINITDVLAQKYDQHAHLLIQAQNVTNDILYTLEDTVASAVHIGQAFAKQSSATILWPYIWCPAASLVMGSYGLPPSAKRNIALVALGELAGFVISFVQSLSHRLPLFTSLGLSSTLAHIAFAASPGVLPTSGNLTA